mgnify:CR=1 FL=1
MKTVQYKLGNQTITQGMDIFAGRNHHFHVGDKILVVGPEENVNRVALVT